MQFKRWPVRCHRLAFLNQYIDGIFFHAFKGGRQQLFSVVSMKLTYFNGESQSATQMGLFEDVGARGIFTSVNQ